ncbi:MAG: hypothetical protein KGZ35_07500 [Truepera sp.]|nr:hypothetical protein [Truepera sp.]
MAAKQTVLKQKTPPSQTLNAGEFYLLLAAKAQKLPKTKVRKLPKDGAINHDTYLAGQ